MESKKPEGTEKETKTQAELDRACLGVLLLLLLVNCFLRPGFLEAEGPGKVGVQIFPSMGGEPSRFLEFLQGSPVRKVFPAQSRLRIRCCASSERPLPVSHSAAA